METIVIGILYLDMLQQLVIPQLDKEDQEGCIQFQQDGAPPHDHGEVREYLKTCFPGRWIDKAAPMAWPHLSPDLIPLDFFLWVFLTDRVFVPPLPANVELQTGIIAAVAEVHQRRYVACGRNRL
jgi:hypothetical protein